MLDAGLPKVSSSSSLKVHTTTCAVPVPKSPRGGLSVRCVRVGVAEALELSLVHGLQYVFLNGGEFGLLHREGLVKILRVQGMFLEDEQEKLKAD